MKHLRPALATLVVLGVVPLAACSQDSAGQSEKPDLGGVYTAYVEAINSGDAEGFEKVSERSPQDAPGVPLRLTPAPLPTPVRQGEPVVDGGYATQVFRLPGYPDQRVRFHQQDDGAWKVAYDSLHRSVSVPGLIAEPLGGLQQLTDVEVRTPAGTALADTARVVLPPPGTVSVPLTLHLAGGSGIPAQDLPAQLEADPGQNSPFTLTPDLRTLDLGELATRLARPVKRDLRVVNTYHDKTKGIVRQELSITSFGPCRLATSVDGKRILAGENDLDPSATFHCDYGVGRTSGLMANSGPVERHTVAGRTCDVGAPRPLAAAALDGTLARWTSSVQSSRCARGTPSTGRS